MAAPSFDQVNGDYQKWLGRPLSQSEYDQYWATAGDYNEGMVANSAEGLARTNQNVPGTGQYTPDVPIAPGNETGQGGPKPTTDTIVTPPPPPPPGQVTGPAPAPTAQTNPGAQAAPGNIPNYSAPPAYVKPPAFSYDPFNAPAPQDLLNDPSYQFEFGQGMQAIGAKNAALGTLNTGGTIKDFESYGQNLASTRYSDLWNRKASEYTMNRGNALDQYNVNYGTQYKDPYSINYQSQYVDPFAFGMQSAGLQQSNNQFNAQLGQQNSQYNSSLDWQKFMQNYKATVTDPFNMKATLLGHL